MKEKMKTYEPPFTYKSIVQLEEGICGAASIIVENPQQEGNGKIQQHEVNTDFGYNFKDNGWDEQ